MPQVALAKRCSGCHELKAASEFHRSAKNPLGLQGYCKPCARDSDRQWRTGKSSKIAQKRRSRYDPDLERRSKRRRRFRDPVGHLLSNVRRSAKRRGLEFRITRADLFPPRFCFVTGVELSYGGGIGLSARPDAASVDRIDHNLGYVPGNVWVVSWRANSMKRDSSLPELRRLVAALDELESNR